MIDKTSSQAMASLLSQIRNYEAKAKTNATPNEVFSQPEIKNFKDVVKDQFHLLTQLKWLLKKWLRLMKEARKSLLTDVVLAMQKSSLALKLHCKLEIKF